METLIYTIFSMVIEVHMKIAIYFFYKMLVSKPINDILFFKNVFWVH